jgi:hypothetical protein
MIAVETIAVEIAANILAACAPGTIPPFELTLRCFTDAYEKLDVLPTESHHQQISDQVAELIRRR